MQLRKIKIADTGDFIKEDGTKIDSAVTVIMWRCAGFHIDTVYEVSYFFFEGSEYIEFVGVHKDCAKEEFIVYKKKNWILRFCSNKLKEFFNIPYTPLRIYYRIDRKQFITIKKTQSIEL